MEPQVVSILGLENTVVNSVNFHGLRWNVGSRVQQWCHVLFRVAKTDPQTQGRLLPLLGFGFYENVCDI